MYKNIELSELYNWYNEDDIDWFVACSSNVLFKYDRRTKDLSVVSAIPTKTAGEFQNPYCIKSGNLVYCIPFYESSIWCYNVISSQWKEIDLCIDKNISVKACLLGEYKEIYYFFSMGLKKIYGMDLKIGTVVSSYDIDVQEETDSYYFDGILVNDCVYLVLGGLLIYEVNLETQNQRKYELDNIDDIVQKINFGGGFFWLIGKKKDIYRWNREDNITKRLTEFPEEFSVYDFVRKLEISDFDNYEKDLVVFCGIYYLNGKVWLIPQSGNKMLYYDQNDEKIKVFEIQNEEETKDTLDLDYRRIATKFFLMYVRGERYLGLYSYKNKMMLEIDTIDMTYENIEFTVNECSLEKLMMQNFYESGSQLTYLIYDAKMNSLDLPLENADTKSVGRKIYMEVSK